MSNSNDRNWELSLFTVLKTFQCHKRNTKSTNYWTSIRRNSKPANQHFCKLDAIPRNLCLNHSFSFLVVFEYWKLIRVLRSFFLTAWSPIRFISLVYWNGTDVDVTDKQFFHKYFRYTFYSIPNLRKNIHECIFGFLNSKYLTSTARNYENYIPNYHYLSFGSMSFGILLVNASPLTDLTHTTP